MKRNKNCRWLAGTTAACVLVGALGIGGTIAYMTDNESTTNTFTVGKIDVDLTEPSYPGNDSPEVKDLVPNQEVQKDPKVTNVGVNDAIVFMSVEVPVKDVTLVKADGTKGAKEKTELFWFKDTADTQGTYANHFSDKWMELTSKGEKDAATGDTNKYVFAYKTAVAKDAVTDNLFDKIQLKNVIEGEVTAGEAQNVVVNTYAIQASEVLEGNTDLTDALTEENLGKIYDIYFNQNPEKEQGGGSEEGPEVKQGTATLKSGSDFNAAMLTLTGDLNKIKSIKNVDTAPEDTVTETISTPGSEKEAVMYFDEASGAICISTNAERISLNEQSEDMFKSCTALTDITALENWNTENVTNMLNMFYDCSSLANIEALANWNIQNVNNMQKMFGNCRKLSNLNALENWNTRNVTTMQAMFYHCDALTNLDALSEWDTSKVSTMGEMFRDCNIQDASGINNWSIVNTTDFKYMFLNCQTHPQFPTYLGIWDSEGTFILRQGTAFLSDGPSFALSMQSVAGDLSKIQSIKYASEKPKDIDSLNYTIISSYNGDAEILMYFEEETGTIFLLTSAAEIYMNADSSNMFSGCSSLTNIDALYNWNTENVTKMNAMFMSCSSLKDISTLSNWNTGNVTYMSEMFSHCSSLSNLEPLQYWDVSNVINMDMMFSYCSSIPSLISLYQWDVSSVNGMNSMFNNCTGLTDVTLSWNTRMVSTMENMFAYCNNLQTVAIGDWDVSGVMTSGFNGMFYGCPLTDYELPIFQNRPGSWSDGTYNPDDNFGQVP